MNIYENTESKFFKIYNELLFEINSGAATFKTIQDLKVNTISAWTTLLNKIPNEDKLISDYYDTGIFSITADKIKELDIKFTQFGDKSNYNRSKELLGYESDQIKTIVNGDKSFDWNVNYKLKIVSSQNNISFPGASFARPDIKSYYKLINKSNIDDLKFNNIKEKHDYLLSFKKEINKLEPLLMILKINSNVNFNKIINDIDKISPLAMHESNHLFEYILGREKSDNTLKKYNDMSDTSGYLIDIELGSFIAGTTEDLKIAKDNGINDFYKALETSDQWREIQPALKKNPSFRSKALSKLNNFWEKLNEKL